VREAVTRFLHRYERDDVGHLERRRGSFGGTADENAPCWTGLLERYALIQLRPDPLEPSSTKAVKLALVVARQGEGRRPVSEPAAGESSG
jgi:hypothetical protein